MINFAKYLFLILAIVLILPLACLFFYANRQINNLEFDTSNKILDTVSREFIYNVENNLKVETVNAMEKLYLPSFGTITKQRIREIFKDCDVEFLSTFPEKITYYYETEKGVKPKLYSVIIIPFLEDDIRGIKIRKLVAPSELKLPGPYFIEIYSDSEIKDENLIGFIAPDEIPEDILGFKKTLKSISLGIPQNKKISYKIFNLDKSYANGNITILIKTEWHMPPANPYERRAGLIIILFGAFLSIFVARYININFINPFLKISAATKRVKLGDLNFTLKTGIKQKAVMETYANFNEMIKGLYEKEELRSGFIRNLTHDLRTPLIAQKRALSLISDKFIELKLEEEKELAKSLEKNTGHLLRMVNLILESYQFNLSKEDLKYETVNISKLVNDSFIKIKPLADEKDIKLINNTITNSTIYSDRTCIERIIINLCANAIENLQNGGYIKISNYDNEKEMRITVEDNGNGIPKEDMEHIFDRYFSSKSYNRKIGSGIGLDVVKKLTEIINGKIELESEVSKYTKFTLTIVKTAEGK